MKEILYQNISLNRIINEISLGLLDGFDDLSEITIIHNTHNDIFIKIIEVDIQDYLYSKLLKSIAQNPTFNTIKGAEHEFHTFVVFTKTIDENNKENLVCANLLDLIMIANYVADDEEKIIPLSTAKEQNTLLTNKQLYNITDENWSIIKEN